MWARLERLVEAWRDEHGPSVKVLLVADNSLAYALQGDDRRKFAELRGTGEVRTATVADGLVLNLARQNRMHVLSADTFKHLRREHPWIEKAPERFHSWTMDADRIRFVPSGIRRITPGERSWTDDFRTVPAAGSKILLRSWRCDAEPCPYSGTRVGHLLVWPRTDGEGRAVCPECGTPLTGLGRRLPTREILVEDLGTGAEITRFLLEDGFPLVVGRGTASGGVDLQPAGRGPAKPLLRVGRQHALLRLDAAGPPRLTVVDLGTRGGTAIARRDGPGFLEPRRLAPDVETEMSLADLLILGGTAGLRASGA
ncbi:hypothetical protein GCM10010468_52640 [Actinocorallia longicatena]|uniref:FHA domain-containing protein n=1 Tax=Actinocorallia longicatena TaxID=111803 RepID=A0ABP6QIV0_9ACTN